VTTGRQRVANQALGVEAFGTRKRKERVHPWRMSQVSRAMVLPKGARLQVSQFGIELTRRRRFVCRGDCLVVGHR
jgi:hypothetical protein